MLDQIYFVGLVAPDGLFGFEDSIPVAAGEINCNYLDEQFHSLS
jgi:hypothetical protein